MGCLCSQLSLTPTRPNFLTAADGKATSADFTTMAFATKKKSSAIEHDSESEIFK